MTFTYNTGVAEPVFLARRLLFSGHRLLFSLRAGNFFPGTLAAFFTGLLRFVSGSTADFFWPPATSVWATEPRLNLKTTVVLVADNEKDHKVKIL